MRIANLTSLLQVTLSPCLFLTQHSLPCSRWRHQPNKHQDTKQKILSVDLFLVAVFRLSLKASCVRHFYGVIEQSTVSQKAQVNWTRALLQYHHRHLHSDSFYLCFEPCWVHCITLYTVHLQIWLQSRGQILGRNPDRSLKSFSPCYLQSLLQLCLEISGSSNLRNLLQFLQCVTVHCKEERRETKPPSLWFKKSIQKPQV